MTFYLGAAAYAEVNLNIYENKTDSDDADGVISSITKEIQPIFGYDLSIKRIFSQHDSFKVSSTLSVNTDESEDLKEIVLLYQFLFD